MSGLWQLWCRFIVLLAGYVIIYFTCGMLYRWNNVYMRAVSGIFTLQPKRLASACVMASVVVVVVVVVPASAVAIQGAAVTAAPAA